MCRQQRNFLTKRLCNIQEKCENFQKVSEDYCNSYTTLFTVTISKNVCENCMKNVQQKVTFPRKVHDDLPQKVRSKSLKYLHFFHKCCFVPNDSAVACTVHNIIRRQHFKMRAPPFYVRRFFWLYRPDFDSAWTIFSVLRNKHFCQCIDFLRCIAVIVYLHRQTLPV